MRVYNPTGITSRGPLAADADFDIHATSETVVTESAGDSAVIVEDMNMDEHTESSFYSKHFVHIENAGQAVLDKIVLETPDTLIASVVGNEVDRLSDGIARIVARHPFVSKRLDLSMVETVGATTQVFESFVTGSLARECADAVDSRIAGETPSVAKPIFTTQNHTTPSYVRNQDCWAAGLDLTCISPWNSTGGALRAGTLVSPRHIVFAKHYMIDVGATVRFVKMDGTVVDRTMTAREYLGDYLGGNGNGPAFVRQDVCVGLLDSDVPSGINFCQILPYSIANQLPNIVHGIPALCIDREENALVKCFYAYSDIARAMRNPTQSARDSFNEPLISGDSGNPGFLIIDSELVLITTWTYGGEGAGPNYGYLIDEVNTAMAALGGGYQLTTKDLSGYPTYDGGSSS